MWKRGITRLVFINFTKSSQKLLSVRYDQNQFRAALLMPTQCSRRETRILWSIASKAADKSESSRTTNFPEYVDISISLDIFKSVDSAR